ncbi:MAG: S41 family peptidase [Fibrobacteraceae bacterium]|nr:S41 family peptidase [Fibrobacteraceae bacterium]
MMMKSVFFKFSFLLLLSSSLVFSAPKKPKEPGDFYEEISRFNKILSEVNRKYVENVDPAEISDAAIEGIRNILDPHTVVFAPEDYEDLKISMEGKFGGVGITISLRDNVLTVISPLAGTPAFKLGIRAGDKIRKIEGNSTKGLTLDEAVEKLRGKIGTDVTISIEREGVPELMDFTITRDEIIVHAIPYYSMIQDDIGYIKLATFADNTTADLENAIKELKKQGMKKLILDLRYNPGGLLNQATSVSELFLKKGNLLVSTKGRTQQTEAYARKDGILSPDVPLVLLVNQGSASASEIVAGAIQDWDRGLIIGKTTFGKGSVQTIFPLDNQGHALKLTTAFYYLPFGRCINKKENGIHGLKAIEESLDPNAEKDSLAKDTTVVDTFHTNKGRKMVGGGGIIPDIDVELDALPWVVQVQERMAMYFKFAVKARPALEKAGAKIDLNWNVPDSLYEQFRDFCLKDTNFTKIKSNAIASADALEEALLTEQKFMGDSSKTVSDTLLARRIQDLKQALDMAKMRQFEEYKTYIKDGIKRELLTAVVGDSISTTFTLKQDKQVQTAIQYLSDLKLYQKALSVEPKTEPKDKPKSKKK